MSIRQADIPADRALVRELWHDYLTWALGELDRHYGFATALMERVGTIERFLGHIMRERPSYSPPVGRLLLAVDEGEVIGTAGLCPIDERAASGGTGSSWSGRWGEAGSRTAEQAGADSTSRIPS